MAAMLPSAGYAVPADCSHPYRTFGDISSIAICRRVDHVLTKPKKGRATLRRPLLKPLISLGNLERVRRFERPTPTLARIGTYAAVRKSKLRWVHAPATIFTGADRKS